MKESVTNLSAMRNIAEILNQSRDLNEALDESLVIICKILDLRAGWVFLLNQDEVSYRLAAAHGLPPGLGRDQHVWQGGCQCNALARSGKLNNAVNMVRCSRIEEAELDTEGLTHHASVPLDTPRGQIGILNVASEDDAFFDQDKLDLLTAVGHQMGVAVERAGQYERVRDQRQREQDALLRLSETILDETDLSVVNNAVVQIAAEALAADWCLLTLANLPDGSGPGGTTAYGLEEDQRSRAMCIEARAPSAFLAISRPGQVLFGKEGGTRVQVFPLEEPVGDDLLQTIANDDDTWLFWRELGCKGIFLAPIRAISSDRRIGLLAVGYKSARKPAVDAHLTALLANQAALAIEQAMLMEVRQRQKVLDRELAVAREIQTTFLPGSLPVIDGWEMAARYEPAREVGGDFYDVIPLREGKLGLAVADVAGKGVPAALVMALSRTMLRAMAGEHPAPVDALTALNKLLLEQSRKDRFLSIFYAVLDTRTGRLRYVRAGHNPPIHYRAEQGDTVPLQGPGLVLGVTNRLVVKEMETELAKGDLLILFTDGVTEAMSPDQEEFSEERLHRMAATQARDPLMGLVNNVHHVVRSFEEGLPPADDFTLLAVRRILS